jgi:malonate-semialdehyde dehydrogenase (acetylating)/methylmalonate-semialdehyde dehydrogenase
VISLLNRSARTAPETVAVSAPDEDGGYADVTYAQLLRRVESAARMLPPPAGGMGEPIGVVTEHDPATPELYLSVLASGNVVVPLSSRLPDHEIAKIAQRAGLGLIIVAGEAEVRVSGLRATCSDSAVVRHADLGTSFNVPERTTELPPGVAMICYTSGTTGEPKGVVLTHENLVAHALTAGYVYELGAGNVIVNALPLAHFAGASRVLLGIVNAGSHVILPRFEPGGFLDAVERRHATHTILAPTMAADLLEAGTAGDHLRGLTMIYGGSEMPADVTSRLVTELGCDLFNHYGSTESSALATALSPADHRQALAVGDERGLASVGRAVPGVEVRIVDDELCPVEPGAVGQVALRGLKISPGYLGDPAATAERFRDGWLLTGDRGEMLSGDRLVLRGRINEMITTGGMNVAPEEIEIDVRRFPGVAEYAAFPVRGESWGQEEETAMTTTISHWVNGAPFAGTSGRTADVTNPATGVVTGVVALASPADAEVIIQAAADAAPGWRAMSLAKRTQIMFAFREILNARKDELAAIITAEHGKVLSDAYGEVSRGQEVVEVACGISHLLKGANSAQAATGVDVHSVRQPLGVVGIISPFNFPAMVPMWFFPLAIAAGNTVVLKPSEKDPSAALWMAERWREAGLPDGVFNVLQGDKVAVDALLRSPAVKAISFVGSTPIAEYVYHEASRAGKRVQALGGAKNHMVVLPDADLDIAADAAVNAGYGSAGERCMAISVVVAVEPIADELIARIADRTRTLVIGDGAGTPDGEADMGPLVTREHRDRVTSFIQSGEKAGAKLVIDGRLAAAQGGQDSGFFLGPTLFDQVTPGMEIYTQEIFGPVLCVVRVSSYEEALRLVNSNEYGNGTAIFTNDGGAARRFEQEVEVGMVGINVPIPVPVAYYSFGGWKRSLFGDTHAHGTEGVHFFTRGKVITSRWIDPANRPAGGLDLGFPRND